MLTGVQSQHFSSSSKSKTCEQKSAIYFSFCWRCSWEKGKTTTQKRDIGIKQARKARKTRTSPGTLSLKKFGLGIALGPKSFRKIHKLSCSVSPLSVNVAKLLNQLPRSSSVIRFTFLHGWSDLLKTCLTCQ